MRNLLLYCNFCKLAPKNNIPKDFSIKEKPKIIDFTKLQHQSKVPPQSVISDCIYTNLTADVDIDSKTIQLLERLSLVDLSNKAALETLKSSIQFADKIKNINTDNVTPLYTVLEHVNLQLREDQITEGNCRAEVLRNAKITDEDYFVSPPGNIPLEQEEKSF